MKALVMFLLISSPLAFGQRANYIQDREPTSESQSSSARRTARESRPDLGNISVFGSWTTVNGDTSITVRQFGAELVFTVNNGDAAGVYPGRLVSPTTIQAFGQYGNLNVALNTIVWSGGTEYRLVSREQNFPVGNVSGRWHTGAGTGLTHITVRQWGMDLLFRVENGAAQGGYRGAFVQRSRISAFNQAGDLDPSGRVIRWSGGTVYRRGN